MINRDVLDFVAGQAVDPASIKQSASKQPVHVGRLRQTASRIARATKATSSAAQTTAGPSTSGAPTITPAADVAAAAASTSQAPASAPYDPERPQSRLKNVAIIPRYIMRLSPDHADANDPEGNKADAAIFSKDVPVEKNRPNWSHQRLPTEFKLDGTNNDPFDDRLNHDTQSAADTRFKVFGQCAGYVNCVFRYQHRTAVFQLFVIGGGFRFLRWDRSAVFVSEKIDYLDDPRTLIDFLLGFVILDAESQGIDPTATLVQKGAPLYRLMDTVAKFGRPDDKQPLPVIVSHKESTPLPDNIPIESISLSRSGPCESVDVEKGETETRASSSKDTGNTSTVFQRPKEGSFLLGHVLDYFSKSLKNWPRYRLVLRDQIFLVGKPIFESTGLVGRGTRGYVAWHVNSNSFVFLKDAWRPYYKTMEAEGETLLRLNAASVVNVPTLVCHGDVENQSTLASDYCLYVDGRTNAQRKADARNTDDKKEKGKKRKVDDLEMRDDELNPRLRHYAHYRICVKEICLPLKEFETSRQLVRIVRDCIDGTWFALPRAYLC